MSITIVFWNVECLPKSISEDKKYFSDERAKLIVPIIQNFDVVMICEAWTNVAKKIFSKAFPYSYTDNGVCGKIFGTGLMILSKYSFDVTKLKIYSDGADWDWFSGKGILFAQLTINGKLLEVFVTQMQATYQNYSKASYLARLTQSLQVVEFVNNNSTPGNNNVWLLGDFNMQDYTTLNNPTTNQFEDMMSRGACYNLIKNQTKMVDVQPNIAGSYPIFTRTPHKIVSITNNSTNGISPGLYIIITTTL